MACSVDQSVMFDQVPATVSLVGMYPKRDTCPPPSAINRRACDITTLTVKSRVVQPHTAVLYRVMPAGHVAVALTSVVMAFVLDVSLKLANSSAVLSESRAPCMPVLATTADKVCDVR